MTRKLSTDRIEYRYDSTHPAYAHLIKQAKKRGVKLQRVINEAVLEWWILRQAGGIISPALPTPNAPEPEPEEPDEPARAAGSDVAEQWM